MGYALELKNVTYTYEGERKPALRDVSLQVRRGEFVLVVGPGGAGKTTLCQVLCGIAPRTTGGKLTGGVEVNGKDLSQRTMPELAGGIGIVFQDPDAQLCNIYVEDEVAFGPENLRVDPAEIRERVTDSLRQVGLSGFERRKVFELSGGQKQKVGIASVLSMHPDILLFDQATAGLDPQSAKDVFELLKKLRDEGNYTIVATETKPDDMIHLVDRLVVMEAGMIVFDGAPRELLARYGDRLADMGLWVPEISELAHALRRDGYAFREFPLTVEEAYSQMKGLWKVKEEEAVAGASGPLRHNTAEPRAGQPMQASRHEAITVRNANYTYPNGAKALSGVSFSVKTGEFVAILGTNGSGKTTLVKHILGLIRPARGTVWVDGQDAAGRTLYELTDRIGFVFQNPEHHFVTDTVFEEAVYSLRVRSGLKHGEALPRHIADQGMKALEFAGLADAKDRNPYTLSGGEKRRLSVISALMLGQQILIMDEPTTGQDYASSIQLLDWCREWNEQGKTIVMITHHIPLVCRYANRVLVMHEGELKYDGSVSGLFAEDNILREASLSEPPVSQLANRLAGAPLPQSVVTVRQFRDRIVFAGERR
ncbi:ABC transporter ATP-binding protein [Paenibacillus sp. MSJ-34]|uniref:ABC transporter ATP-binding protein n=1 Tax=Paenibacillus sp. MSJ-34 TaxID=2841529 RepID=UPI001C118D3F|nr:energy-coupling factor transporter ATPase [Paenibacillus sp. MSJ-34]MBU5442015.1 ATP-binding cassette domain-containing protein [Paenibacillus sp. MSJ-34]